MKRRFCSALRSSLLLTISLLAASVLTVPAQTGSGTDFTVPVVTVTAPDSSASEAGDAGAFRLFRDGPTNAALNVYCVFDGTASNGVDYATIPNWISVPAGVRAVSVPVNPIDDKLVEESETVILRLV